LISNLLHLLLAYSLALPMAIERERHARSAGLRTFPLVGMASCAFVLTALSAFGAESDAHARVLYGLMTGIGFIGGGAILKQGSNVKGTATAASIWSTGAIGAAVGFGSYDIAIGLSVATAATLLFSPALKEKIDEEDTVDGSDPGSGD
jgi:putative Mg2+ transporter-C (MgtC) family protein